MTDTGNGLHIQTPIGGVSASGTTTTNVLLIIAVIVGCIYVAASLHIQSNAMRDQHDGIREAIGEVTKAMYAIRDASDDNFIAQMVTEDQKKRLDLPPPIKKKVEEKLERKAARIANKSTGNEGDAR